MVALVVSLLAALSPRPDLVGAPGARARHRGGRRRAGPARGRPGRPWGAVPRRRALGGPVRLRLPARPRQHGARRHGDPRRPGHRRHGQRSTRSTATPASTSPARSCTCGSTPCAGSRTPCATAASSTTTRRASRCASTSSRSTAGSGWMPRCPAPTRSPSTSTGGPRPPASPRPCPSATCASAPTGSTPRVVEQPAFTWVLGTDVSIGPVQVPRAVDLRQDGRIAVHVWAPRAVVTVTDTPRDAVTDSNA